MAHLDVPRSCFCCSLPDMAALKVLPIIHTTIVIAISYSFSSVYLPLPLIDHDAEVLSSVPSSCYSPFPPSFSSASISQPSSSSSPFSSRRHHGHHHHDSPLPVLWFQLPWTTKVGPRVKVVVKSKNSNRKWSGTPKKRKITYRDRRKIPKSWWLSQRRALCGESLVRLHHRPTRRDKFASWGDDKAGAQALAAQGQFYLFCSCDCNRVCSCHCYHGCCYWHLSLSLSSCSLSLS